ncbi:TetR/AcrR family transcriptional regulator [Kosmotoga olearia]|uniref:Transcriptional regulator, TetR family n=1 Tax=Kosmotoga olearia (strain ATCC BAA-1733 / DSM 21960 / TBF 19.5.1) TaxID=521045 RepID=C5CIC0_KOSOT|nr:TetR/AcrR family transcriptional regulator [Kosmotoga olearia]ACR78854.1 transcriptional regulator, TetR family [Kosmotoga olearia TBF 19.5.1]
MQIKKEDKKDRILKSAEKLFAEKGYANVSISEIAKDAKVGKGTIYVYFSSKEEILDAVALRIFEEFVDGARYALEMSKNLKEFLELLAEKLSKDVENRSKILAMFHRERLKDRSKYREITSEYRKVFMAAYERYRDEFKIPFDEMFAFMRGIFMSAYTMADNITEESIKIFLKKILLCFFDVQKDMDCGSGAS